MTDLIKKKSVEFNKKKKHLSITFITTITAYILCVLMFSFLGNYEAIFNGDNYLNYKVGDVVNEDVYANREIYLIDEDRTDKKKELARSLAFPVFKIYEDITHDVLVEYDAFVSQINNFREQAPRADKTKSFTDSFAGIISNDQLETLLNDVHLADNLSITRNVIQTLMNRGVIFTDDAYEIPPTGIMEIWREVGDDFDKSIFKYNQLPRKETLSLYIHNELKTEELSVSDFKTIEVFSTFFIRENCFLDEFQSRIYEDQAVSRVKPVEIYIGKGDLILEKGLVVSPEIESMFMAISKVNDDKGFLYYLSPFVFAGFLFVFGIIYFNIFSPQFASDTKLDILFYSLLSICIFISYMINIFASPPLNLPIIVLIPVALFSMLVTLLSDKKTGLIFQLILSISLFYISDYQLEFLFISLFSGITGCLIIEGAERRIDIIRAGLLQSVFQVFIFISFQLFAGFDLYIFLWGTLIMFINGFISGILALGLLPVLEHWMKSCTRFRLIELSDFNAPILKNMLAKAPGTYIHSMNVANLAEMACQEIGANSLLAKVGGLYHDIGKVDQSEYFIENQTDVNKHDDMKPSLSAAVLKAHVKIGIEKGNDLNLPKEVVDIIAEHHATSTMKFFYDKAMKEKGYTKVNKDDFSYSGPNPQTREAAIVMLADTIEAATRTLKKPSLAKLEKYVWELIMDKFINGELNDCSLTFKDMEFVKSSFVHVLAGHFHTRIEYPDEQKNKEKETDSEQS